MSDMIKNLIIILTFFSHPKDSNLQHISSCSEGFLCIPLSECSEMVPLIKDDSLLDLARSLVCGYFHEPYVCCNRDCYTPNGSFGKQTLLGNCLQLEGNKYSKDPKKIKFLEESYLNDTHVCCSQEIEYKFVPSAPTDVTTEKSISKPSNRTCVTPNGKTGLCVAVSQCEAYHVARTRTDEEFRFINDSFCGYWTEPMVCCSNELQYDEKFVHNAPKPDKCGYWNDTASFPPWLAFINSKNKLGFCVGALISAEYVLTTTRCAEDLENLYVKFGACIQEEEGSCKFWIRESKRFPVHNYVFTKDTGIVLLKLSRPTLEKNGIFPICLPTNELPTPANIDVVGLRRTYFGEWKTIVYSYFTILNDECHEIMEEYLENIVCIKSWYFCKVRKNLLENFIIRIEDGRWYIQGLFSTESCLGPSNDYTIGIYVYKFLNWIHSNLG